MEFGVWRWLGTNCIYSMGVRNFNWILYFFCTFFLLDIIFSTYIKIHNMSYVELNDPIMLTYITI